MINYTYTPGDRIVSLNEDLCEVETDSMIFEMDLMDLFESWMEYQLNGDVLEETKTMNKILHQDAEIRQKVKDGDVKGTKMAIKKADSYTRGHLIGKQLQNGDGHPEKHFDVPDPEFGRMRIWLIDRHDKRNLIKAAKANAKANKK